jgi:GH25 family lysozyme M1 (1,4-beta-N-acetylmuramidase)
MTRTGRLAVAEGGFDLSSWQSGAYEGGGGFSFGLAKACEGYWKDPAYDRHIAAIRAAGLVPGAYAYNRYDLGNSPEDEADFLLQVVGDPRGMLLAADMEVAFRGPLTEWRARWLARIASRLGGYQAPWYSYSYYIDTHALNTAQTTWCWLAWPDSNGGLPGVLVPVRMQQYGLTSVPGVPGSVDANRFFGSQADLRALTVGGAIAPSGQQLPLEELMPLTITRADGKKDVFSILPDGSGRHVEIGPAGDTKVFDDPLPGSWACWQDAFWDATGGTLTVIGLGWQNGVGGQAFKVEWSSSNGQWVGPTWLAG